MTHTPIGKAKRVAVAILLAGSLFGADSKVLVTESGKTYHSHKCMALMRSKTVYTVAQSAAEAHSLKPCGICYRAKASSKKAAGSAWMKEAK